MRKYYLNFLFVVFCLLSCSKKVTFEKNGGMVLTFEINENNYNLKEALKKRINIYSRMASYECIFIEKNNKLEIKLPFFLNDIQLNNLLFSQGELKIIKDDSIYFNLSSVKNSRINFNAGSGSFVTTLILKDEYKKQFENFTIKNLGDKIKIQIDTTVLMTPNIRDTISNGVVDIIVLETTSYSTYTLYSILNEPYDRNFVVNNFNKRFFLKSDDKLNEIPLEVNDLYNKIKELISKNRTELFNDLKEINRNDRYSIESEINTFLNNDLGGYLAISTYKDTSELKDSFLELQIALQSYNKNSELINSIKDLLDMKK
jgi:hypothetical protein